jgi:hypothetical protein
MFVFFIFQNFTPFTGEVGGCPFKHFDRHHLNALLDEMGLSHGIRVIASLLFPSTQTIAFGFTTGEQSYQSVSVYYLLSLIKIRSQHLLSIFYRLFEKYLAINEYY